jgi:hypothetical protein
MNDDNIFHFLQMCVVLIERYTLSYQDASHVYRRYAEDECIAILSIRFDQTLFFDLGST